MPIPSSEIAMYRAAMRDVSTLAEADLLRYWKQFDLTDAEKVRNGLLDVLPGLVNGYYLTAATVAADWYDLMRLEAEVPRTFSAVIPEEPTAGRATSLARWAVTPLFSDKPLVDVALTKVLGGLQRTVQNGARETVVQSVYADPAPVGWERVGAGNCDFCRMLISRGPVYSASSGDFESHDHCQCSAVPAFD